MYSKGRLPGIISDTLVIFDNGKFDPSFNIHYKELLPLLKPENLKLLIIKNVLGLSQKLTDDEIEGSWS